MADSPRVRSRHHRLQVAAACVAGFVVLLGVVVYFFPWDVLREPINRYVSEKTGRDFAITQRLDVKLGRTAHITLTGVRFANPEWARDPQLIEADGVDIDLRLLPLLHRQIEMPVLRLHNPRLAMQLEADGRRSWALGRDSGDPGNFPRIGVVQVDNGELKMLAKAQGADLKVDFSLAGSGDMPLEYRAGGTYRNQPFTAEGRTGNVLQLHDQLTAPFPVEVTAQAARTRITAKGSITSLASLEGIRADFDLQGNSLGDLYGLLGVVLPHTPPYAVKGSLSKQGDTWNVAALQGRLGSSDIGGELAFEQRADKPRLTGHVQSRVLDMNDLGPLFGATPPGTAAGPNAVKPVAAKVAGETGSTGKGTVVQIAPPKTDAVVAAAEAGQPTKAAAPVVARPGKVLPNAPLDFERLAAMNADVVYSAASIRHLQAVPLDQASVHVVLQDSVLSLDPLGLGVAGGKVAGQVRIDARQSPALVKTNLDVRGLQLDKMFPTIEKMKGSLGRFDGHVRLDGPGNSVADWLGHSSGELQMLTGRGQMSNILLEVLGLDAGELIKFFVAGDRNVELRCAAVSFGVKNGLMSSQAIVLDTTDTVVWGTGAISLANETIDIRLKPQPKDRSILSLRSPLRIAGTFANPKAGPEMGALAGRAGVALALAVVNPLLALAATIETGPGKDADCAAVLAGKSMPVPPEVMGAATPAEGAPVRR